MLSFAGAVAAEEREGMPAAGRAAGRFLYIVVHMCSALHVSCHAMALLCCSMSVELLLAMNASCGACASLGPPPSAILTLPPPPLPAFLKASGDGAVDEDTPCDLQGLLGLEGLPQTCDWHGSRAGTPGVEFVELPRQVGGMGVGADDDTWFLVLVSCCAGVILLGAVLAVVLMRCRQ